MPKQDGIGDRAPTLLPLLLTALNCAASCAGSEAEVLLCARATIIARIITITPTRSNTRVVDFGRLGEHRVASHPQSVFVRKLLHFLFAHTESFTYNTDSNSSCAMLRT